MKKIFLLAGVAALAACGSNEAPADDAAVDAAPATVAYNDVGTWDISNPDGSTARTQLNADGTYVDIVDGDESGGGTWRRDGDSLCFDGSAEGEEEACWNTTAEANGSFTATDANGVSVNVSRVAETAAE